MMAVVTVNDLFDARVYFNSEAEAETVSNIKSLPELLNKLTDFEPVFHNAYSLKTQNRLSFAKQSYGIGLTYTGPLFNQFVGKNVTFIYNGGTHRGKPRVIKVQKINDSYLEGTDLIGNYKKFTVSDIQGGIKGVTEVV